ncbi:MULTISPECIES: hydroxyisourate hydrolase [Alphaproteobacteria]|uniref:5-hydroxyisourate hydrolase n=2 Tax=Alphaproteobacteria TaxID=28211 RepID=A0A512HF25_9HYPH|nr:MULTISPECIES: hydroxyisourate hydrolase [Alphaproteobacteria]GEO84048.1 5-hydroxyisourate hydrolase [Ciceribacter naphthalenivorans]GLR21074.1 5-hydroxyisourate hydrolase [Ciceribacter naphthalenivorans]GLT03930.1 5-hydroxyisourate hydrolase [Sphingomonas psychrolutea]
MTGLTTHVLDTALGKPADGLKIQLMRMNGEEAELITTVFTNSDGRVDGGPLLVGADFQVGQYELLFHAGDYLKTKGVSLTDPPFLDVIPIRFGISDTTAHYHVPLLLSPYGYSTYRGS